MEDMERRALLGVAGIGALAALAKAGPLSPPGGAVAVSGHSLEEVYNKIPAVGGSDGRTPIPGGTSPVTLSQAGSYVLTGNLAVSSTPLTITVAGVTVDLNGFRITNTGTSTYGIHVTAPVGQTIIRNGSISGGVYGLFAATSGTVTFAEDVTIYNPRLMGFYINGAPGCGLRRCRVIGAGTTSTGSDTSNVYAVNLSSPGARIEGCTVALCENNGSGIIRGFSVTGAGTTVDGCQAVNDVSVAGSFGIYMFSNTVYRNCTAYNFPTKFNSGVDGGGNF